MYRYSIKIGDFLDALKKNGYPWHKGDMITYLGDEGYGACAMGQAALNVLELAPEKAFAFREVFTSFSNKLDEAIWMAGNQNRRDINIICKNDSSDTEKYEEVSAYAEERLSDLRDKTVTFVIPTYVADALTNAGAKI